jgi:hypothetical protein
MNAERIGQAAGSIWQRLHGKGCSGISFSDLKKLAGYTPDEAMAGVGWLAREGKLSFKSDGKKTMVTLVEEECLVAT